MLFGEAKYFTHLSTGHFFFCRKFMFGKKKKEKTFGRDCEGGQNSPSGFWCARRFVSWRYFKCQVMLAGKNGLNSQRVMCSGTVEFSKE